MRVLKIFGILLVISFSLFASEQEEATLTKVGQVAPEFSIQQIDGTKFDLAKQRGSVVVLNFFATWCGPCIQELPVLEREVWKEFEKKGVKVLVVGREETADKIKAFREKQKLTMPFAPDPDKKVYSLYATKFIPRTYVIDKGGKIVHQTVGYTPEEFKKLVEAVRKVSGG
jgi:peroxiredoxin